MFIVVYEMFSPTFLSAHCYNATMPTGGALYHYCTLNIIVKYIIDWAKYYWDGF